MIVIYAFGAIIAAYLGYIFSSEIIKIGWDWKVD